MTPEARYAYNYYLQRGYSPQAAAAIVGRLMQESGPNLNPRASGDKGTAFGVAQWRGDRQAGLKDWAAQNRLPYDNLDTQLGYVDWELQNREKVAQATLAQATDPVQAAKGMMHYERPAGWTLQNPEAGHGFDNTVRNAAGLLGLDPSTLPTAAPQGSYSGYGGEDSPREMQGLLGAPEGLLGSPGAARKGAPGGGFSAEAMAFMKKGQGGEQMVPQQAVQEIDAARPQQVTTIPNPYKKRMQQAQAQREQQQEPPSLLSQLKQLGQPFGGW